MKKLFVLAVLSILFSSCNKDEEPLLLTEGNNSNADYIVFGDFYGFCAGDQCINIFKITSNALYENTTKEYPSTTEFYPSTYVQLSQEKFEAVKSIYNATPSSLLSIEEGYIGCPDCADGGGIYFEYKKGDIHKHWLIDLVDQDLPEEIKHLVNQVYDATTTLKQ